MPEVHVLKGINLTKTFPGVVALKGVNFEVKSGYIHTLVGANGAGKSTLIKILTGYYDTYGGRIEIDGTPVRISCPNDAFSHGIEAVYQEVDTTLVPYLSVAENLLIEELASGATGAFLHKSRLFKKAQHVIETLGLSGKVNVWQRIETLPLHYKQLLVIARAVARKASFLILDEPTSSLDLNDVERLFNILKHLKKQGIGIIYISHRLDEVKEIADEVTVLKDGQKAAYFNKNFSLPQIVEAMLGRAQQGMFPPREKKEREGVVLETRHLTQYGHVYDVNFRVYKGEVLGITGLTGAGKSELLQLLFGARKPDTGEILIDGHTVRLSHPGIAVKHGVYLVPEERRRQGLHLENTVRENITLPFLRMFCAWSFIRKRLERAHAQQAIEQIELVPPDPEKKVKYLSGGNQQKVVVGKWFGGKARVIMFDEATQGIDVGAKREIYHLVYRWARDAGVIFVSSDIDEVLGIADRVLVMNNGRVVAEFLASEANRQIVLEYATGARSPDDKNDTSKQK